MKTVGWHMFRFTASIESRLRGDTRIVRGRWPYRWRVVR